MSGLKKSHKLLAGLVAAALASGGIGTAVYAETSFFNFGGGTSDESAPVQLELAEVRDIENSINLTGALSSASETSVSADTIAKELLIKEVKVRTGDEVKAGDVLFTLDTEEIEKTLSQEEQKRAVEERKNEISDAQAARSLAELEANNDIAEAQAYRHIWLAEDKLNDSYYDHGLALDKLYEKYGVEDQTYYEAVSAQLAMYDAEDAVSIAMQDPNISTEDLNDLKEVYNTAVETFNKALSTYEDAISASIEQEGTIRSDNRTLRDSESALIDDYENLDKTLRAQQIEEKKAREEKETTALTRSVSNFESDNTMEKIHKQLAAAIVTAPSSGVVTAVNATVGAAASADAVVITDINHFSLSCDVDEQYIADIQKGMSVRFTTNATGNDVLSGEVTFVAVTPTKQQSSNNSGNGEGGGSSASTSGSTDKSRGTYRVLIKVNDSNERLRPGMSAKITIITANAKNVLTVPNQCLGSNMNGDTVVQVTTDGGATSREVVVTTGLTDGSYTEIVGNEIKEGDQLVVPDAIEIEEESVF